MKTQLYLTPRDHGRRRTLVEFESADSLDGFRYELIGGNLEVALLPNFPPDFLREWLADLLGEYARRYPHILRRVQSPARVFVPGRRAVTAPEPDVAAYRDFPASVVVDDLRWQD